jgi:hypothetical protein
LPILAIWLLVLSLVVVGMVRHVATLELARQAGPLPLLHYDFDRDGPEIGAAVPVAVADLLSARRRSVNGSQVLFFFSPGCGTCLEVASEVIQRPAIGQKSVFIVLGPETGGAAAEMREVLARTHGPVVEGEEARVAMRALSIRSIPFAVRVSGGQISQKLFLRRTTNIKELFPESFDGQNEYREE